MTRTNEPCRAQSLETEIAIGNAIGSNIFDICVCLGVPVFFYCLFTGDRTFDANSTAEIQALLWVLTGLTVCVLALFLLGRHMGRIKATMLVVVYIVWIAFVIGRSQSADWTNTIVRALPGAAAPAVGARATAIIKSRP